MNEEIKKILEGQTADTLTADDEVIEGTSPVQENAIPELNSNAVPEECSCPAQAEEEHPEPVLEESVESTTVNEETPGIIDVPQFTQSQVNDMMGKVRAETRERTLKFIYDRYGVTDESGMDGLAERAQRFDLLKDDYEGYKQEAEKIASDKDLVIKGIKEDLALLQSGIDKERYDDAKYILRGKGLDIDLDNIMAEIETHPEWVHKEQNIENPEIASMVEKMPEQEIPAQDVSKLNIPVALGNGPADGSNGNPEQVSERDQARRWFGLR